MKIDFQENRSDICFSNGYLDPWSGGGWSLEPKTQGSLISIIIKVSHYELSFLFAQQLYCVLICQVIFNSGWCSSL